MDGRRWNRLRGVFPVSASLGIDIPWLFLLWNINIRNYSESYSLTSRRIKLFISFLVFPWIATSQFQHLKTLVSLRRNSAFPYGETSVSNGRVSTWRLEALPSPHPYERMGRIPYPAIFHCLPLIVLLISNSSAIVLTSIWNILSLIDTNKLNRFCR